MITIDNTFMKFLSDSHFYELNNVAFSKNILAIKMKKQPV